MTTSLRWGILGTGGIAASQTSDLNDNGFTVTAVGSRTQQSADAFASRWGIATAHPSYEALVADENVDAIYVSTPHPFHYENALLALNAGKHVLVEKPFVMNAAQAREVVELATEKNLVVLEAMWTRYLPHMVRIRELLAAGALGELRTLISDHSQNLPKDPKHRINDPALGGGALLDLGIYPVSFSFDVFGAPTGIHASATMTATGVDAQTTMIFEYEGNQRAIMVTALDALGPNTTTITGTEGRIEIDAVWYNPTSFRHYNASNEVVESYTSEGVIGRGMQYQAWELERLVASGAIANDVLSPEGSVQIMEAVDEVRHLIGLRYDGVDTEG
jgi:predicted dehydrogenase